MPVSTIAELILGRILEFIFHVLGYYIGRGVVSVLTLGSVKCDRVLADTPRRKLRRSGTYHRRGHYIYLTPEATALIGLVLNGPRSRSLHTDLESSLNLPVSALDASKGTCPEENFHA